MYGCNSFLYQNVQWKKLYLQFVLEFLNCDLLCFRLGTTCTRSSNHIAVFPTFHSRPLGIIGKYSHQGVSICTFVLCLCIFMVLSILYFSFVLSVLVYFCVFLLLCLRIVFVYVWSSENTFPYIVLLLLL